MTACGYHMVTLRVSNTTELTVKTSGVYIEDLLRHLTSQLMKLFQNEANSLYELKAVGNICFDVVGYATA